MRHKIKTKVEKGALKYAVLDKRTSEITIYRFKTAVADLINVSTRTLDRTIPYENNCFAVYLIANVVL
jgi:hypothetical protein